MTCENEYCIYNNKNKCRLENTSINTLGMCDDCIIVSLDKKLLVELKETQLHSVAEKANP